MLRLILYRLIFLVILVIALNFVYEFFLYKRDLKINCENALLVHELNDKKTDLVYISDCSNTNSTENDSSKNSILDNLNLFYPELKMKAIDHAAAHAGIFKEWIEEFDVKKPMPKALIVTVNLRSFGAQWIHSDLESSLQQSIVLLKPYPKIINRFLLAVKGYDYKTKEEREKMMFDDWKNKKINFPYKTNYQSVKHWDSLQANTPLLLPNGKWDLEKMGLACHYVKAFAFNIDSLNPRIKDYDEIATWAAKAKVKLYFNIIPENVEYANSLVNKDLLFLMRQNAEFIVNRYTNKNCIVLNNLELLDGEEFTEKNWTTEHYSFKGRMLIARSVALGIKNQFERNYFKKY